MPSKNQEFATYCCDLLGTIGPCVLQRMFGGYGISVDGLTVAIMTDLGQGEKLWLKAEDDSRALFEAAGCQRFGYLREGVSRGMNYYSAPEEAMDSPQQMAPWARLALEAALTAAAKATSKVKASTKVKPSLKAKAKVKAKVAAPPASGKSAKTVKPRS
jgi:DNA transformation protein and related proteins